MARSLLLSNTIYFFYLLTERRSATAVFVSNMLKFKQTFLLIMVQMTFIVKN